MESNSRTGIYLVLAAIALGGLAIISRLFYLQIVLGETYTKRAEARHSTQVVSEIHRGDIFFKKKDGEFVRAATTASGHRLVVQPALLQDARSVIEQIAPIIGGDPAVLYAKIEGKTTGHIEIANRLTKEQGSAITALGIRGVALGSDYWRVYPGKRLASSVIGFVGYANNERAGQYGVERMYNHVLDRPDERSAVNIFARIFGNMQSTVITNTSLQSDVILTIEPVVQLELERILAQTHARWNSDSVGGIVMDPKTGAIIAMAQLPNFDSNEFSKETDASVFQNSLVQNVFEVGSVIKPLVVASALDAGTITPQTRYTDTGSVTVRDRTFHNFDKKGRGVVPVETILVQSLNTGMVFIQQSLGQERFRHYLLDIFKFGEKTDIDLPGEVNGLVRNIRGSNEVDFAAASFGQGIALSPISLVRAFAVLANGGSLVTPYVVSGYRDERGIEVPRPPIESTRVLGSSATEAVRSMMIATVDSGLGGGMYKKDRYAIAAKTGTAQVARPDGSGYFEDRNLHSLIGYFPAYQPEFVLYVYSMNPKGAYFASETLGKPFFQTVDFLIGYYGILPDR